MDVPQTADSDSIHNETIESILELREGDTVRFTLAGEEKLLPDFYSDGMVLEVTETRLSHTSRGLENYYKVFLSDPNAGLGDDPLFKVTASRNVPSNRKMRVPENPKWNSAWAGHKNYNKYGNYHPMGTHSIEELEVVDTVPCCTECGRVVSQ